jgi:hypothetical protein
VATVTGLYADGRFVDEFHVVECSDAYKKPRIRGVRCLETSSSPNQGRTKTEKFAKARAVSAGVDAHELAVLWSFLLELD